MGLAFDTAIAAAQYAMTATACSWAMSICLRMKLPMGGWSCPMTAVIEEGYGYYLKLHADDLADPAISMFRSWLISRFGALRQG